MKKTIGFVLTLMMLQAPFAFAAMVEDWSNIASGSVGPYQDSMGSKIDYTIEAGPKGGKALQINANVVTGGYAGVYHNITADLSKSGSIKFMAKSTVAGDVQIAVTDAFHVQYIAKFPITATKDWVPVEVSLASFTKDPYYTPPNAVPGHPIDWSVTGNLNFSPQMQGAPVVVEIGPVESAGTASAAPAAKAAPAASSSTSASAAPSGPGVHILDAATVDSKSAGSFQDSMGSTFVFVAKDDPNKKGKKFLSINYELKQGGYCGMWCRAGGPDWNGAVLGSAKTIEVTLYSKDPVVLGLGLKDKNNNQYVAETPISKGGKWETVSVSLDSFILDPYYTPPDAKKGAPKDFSQVKTFNIQPKTVGKFTVGVSAVVGK